MLVLPARAHEGAKLTSWLRRRRPSPVNDAAWSNTTYKNVGLDLYTSCRILLDTVLPIVHFLDHLWLARPIFLGIRQLFGYYQKADWRLG